MQEMRISGQGPFRFSVRPFRSISWRPAVQPSISYDQKYTYMIGVLRSAAKKAPSLAAQARSMSSGPVDIATEIKELKKWKVRVSA
jgi:hypothetical protein